jgi:hypothetical protein
LSFLRRSPPSCSASARSAHSGFSVAANLLCPAWTASLAPPSAASPLRRVGARVAQRPSRVAAPPCPPPTRQGKCPRRGHHYIRQRRLVRHGTQHTAKRERLDSEGAGWRHGRGTRGGALEGRPKGGGALDRGQSWTTTADGTATRKTATGRRAQGRRRGRSRRGRRWGALRQLNLKSREDSRRTKRRLIYSRELD